MERRTCRLDGGLEGAAVLLLRLHHLEGALGEPSSLLAEGELAVEHQQCVVAIGDAGDEAALDEALVLLDPQQLGLAAA